MNKTLDKNKSILKLFFSEKYYVWSTMIMLLIMHVCYPLVNRVWYQFYLAKGGGMIDLTRTLDHLIPTISPFIVVYHLWSLTVFWMVIKSLRHSRNEYSNYVFEIVAAYILAFITFFVFPTVVPRPPIDGNGLFDQLLMLTRAADNPYCGFPSLHVLIVLIMGRSYLRIEAGRVKRALMVLWLALIVLSTLFTKQHVIIDLLGSAIFFLPTIWLGRKLQCLILSNSGERVLDEVKPGC